MNILEKRELAEVIKDYNKGNLTKFLDIVKKHCPSVYGLNCAGHDNTIDCKGNCHLCWSFALRQFAFEHFGDDLSEIKPQQKGII